MEGLLKALEAIENEHKEYFETRKYKLYHYVSISKKPVMIRFNRETDSKQNLPNDIYDKVNKLIMSYYNF